MARSKKKKWKSRIKKALKLAAIGGAGYLAAKAFGGRKGNVSKTAAMEDANINVTHPALEGPYISKKAPVDNVASAAADSGPVLNVTGGIHAGKPAKGMLFKQRALTAGNKIPPSMRGGLEHAEGYQRKIPGRRHYPGGWEGGYSMRAKGGRIGAKKGGRVTGIAKRGFGRALMKGKK